MSTSEQLKDQGNIKFKEGKLPEAVQLYSKAIQHDPSNSILFANRALVYLKMDQPEQALIDAEKCVELDGKRFKNRYLLGQSLEKLGRLQGAKSQLEAALALTTEADNTSLPAVESLLAKVKKAIWDHHERTRNEALNDHHLELNKVINEHYDRVEKEAMQRAQQHKSEKDIHQWSLVAQRRNDLLTSTFLLFEKTSIEYEKRIIPEFMTCPISFEIMRDPVITPAGHSYDRISLQQHLRRIGKTDPLTRQPLTEDQMIPNIALRDAIEQFLKEHPWAEVLDMS